MGNAFTDFANIISKPLSNVQNFMQNAWNDYSGVTASKLSAEAAAKNTEKQLAWEKERATSAHQWEVEDLKKAGLNPILSAGGSGAVTSGITPQLPDYSQYKGWGAIVPLIGNMYQNLVSNSQAKKNTSEAQLADTRKFTELSNVLVNLANEGLIKKKTAGQAIENEINEINRDWLPYEKGVDIAKDVATTGTQIYVGGRLLKGAAMTSTKMTKSLAKLNKQVANLNNPWKNIGDGRKVNMITGELKNTRKTTEFNYKKINDDLNKSWQMPKNYKKKYLK